MRQISLPRVGREETELEWFAAVGDRHWQAGPRRRQEEEARAESAAPRGPASPATTYRARRRPLPAPISCPVSAGRLCLVADPACSVWLSLEWAWPAPPWLCLAPCRACSCRSASATPVLCLFLTRVRSLQHVEGSSPPLARTHNEHDVALRKPTADRGVQRWQVAASAVGVGWAAQSLSSRTADPCIAHDRNAGYTDNGCVFGQRLSKLSSRAFAVLRNAGN